MTRKIITLASILAILVSLIGVLPVAAGEPALNDPIAMDGTPRIKNVKPPVQLGPAEAAAVVAASATTGPMCFGDGGTLTLTLNSFDANHPGSQDVVFWKETAATSTGMGTLWVAWDFMTTDTGRADVITCAQLAYLQGQIDAIVATDVKYFDQYTLRPDGNENIDIMIYNIVDESYFDSEYPSYIAGFFSSGFQQLFNRNMIFIDTYDWANRLGGTARRPYLYEGVVAHELEHLIHNDRDGNEDSWVDEGLADLAGYLCGFGHPDSHVVYYLAYHRTPLTVWGGGLESYGASYLFQLYLLEQFGEKDGDVYTNEWTRKLVNEPLNSIAGIEAATGAEMNDLYDAWVMANYLDAPALTRDGLPLGYGLIDLNPFVGRGYSAWSIKRSVTDIYGSDHKGNVPIPRIVNGGYKSGQIEYPLGMLGPYAPMYGTFKGMEPVMNINLRGAISSGVAAHGGNYHMASGASNMLTDRMLALNSTTGGTLTFWTWYDIETEWDYGFVEVSTDGGATWAPLAGSITKVSANPNGSTAWNNSLLGSAESSDAVITGNSGGWVQASFALPEASGVSVRFSYYTDEATLGQGWFIDDVKITGVDDGFESGAANWTVGGWVWTTGLFANDWMAAWDVPTYANGKLKEQTLGWLDAPTSTTDKWEHLVKAVNTLSLNKDWAMVVISNRPGESPFDANYRILVNK